MIPEGWKERPLSQLVSRLDAGVSVNSGDRQSDGVEPGILKTSCVSNGVFRPQENKVVNSEVEIIRLAESVKAGSIIISRMNTPALVGANALIKRDFQYLFLPDRLWQAKPRNSKVDMPWLAYYLGSPRGRHALSAGATGTSGSMKNISKSDVFAIRLLVPPLSEQKRIAEILSTWDRAIETTEKLIANSEAQKKALMQQLLTAKKRLPGFSGEWKAVAFNDLFERVRDKNVELNENVLTISAQHGLVSQTEYFKKSVAGRDLSGYTLIKQGDFAYNKSYSAGYPMGAIKPLEHYHKGIVSSLYICFRVLGRSAHHDFYRHYFEGSYFNKEIYGIAQEGARNHGLLNVSVTDFFSARIVAPQIEEQKAIASVINAAEHEIIKLETLCRDLKAEKSALMQQLLTGKRRVKLDKEVEAT